MSDALVLLIQGLFSATQQIQAGGTRAKAPVEAIGHKYRGVQVQMVGLRHRLTPFKAAQAFEGMATFGAMIGFYESSIFVVQDRKGPIARIDIV